jgi:hypothetical protein
MKPIKTGADNLSSYHASDSLLGFGLGKPNVMIRDPFIVLAALVRLAATSHGTGEHSIRS